MKKKLTVKVDVRPYFGRVCLPPNKVIKSKKAYDRKVGKRVDHE